MSNFCGIYLIEAIGGNQEGWKYVGLSNQTDRQTRHFGDLRSGNHHSGKLQDYFNEFGESSFRFTEYMECPENELGFWEKFWIKAFDSKNNGFNETNGGEGTGRKINLKESPVKIKNMVTDEVIEIHSLSETARKINVNRSALGRLVKGKNWHAKDWYIPDGEWTPKKTKVYDINNNEYLLIETKIMEFCREHNIRNVSLFYKVLNGKWDIYMGWRLNPKIQKRPVTGPVGKDFRFISPEGQLVEGQNLAKFSSDNNVSYHSICRVKNKELRQVKGWRLYEDGMSLTPFSKKEYVLVSPSGEIVKVNRLSELAKTHNLSADCLKSLYGGRQAVHRGWTKYIESPCLQ